MTREDRLARHAARLYEAFQMLRLVECAHPSSPRLGAGARPSIQSVRLAQDAELRFSSAQVTSYEPASESGPARLALDFGLLGPDGPMPLHLTEYVRSRVRHYADRTMERFLDIFHHRMSSLLYRAWAAGQPVIGLDRPGEDRFAVYVDSLCGHSPDRPAGPDAIADDARREAAGLLCDRRRHAAGLAALLTGALGAPVSIEPFVGQWLTVPAASLTRLGGHGSYAFGEGCVLGRRVWDRQHKFRIVIGPVDAALRERLYPGTEGFRRLAAWVRLYAGVTFGFEVVVRLNRDAAPAMRLGVGARLARNAWLGRTDARRTEPILRFDGDRFRISRQYN